MPFLAALPFIAQGISTGANVLSNLLYARKRFNDTEYGKRLRALSIQGKYSPAVMANVLGQIGRETANVAQQARTNMRGYLIQRGMDKSISGVRQLANVDLQRMQKLGDTARDLSVENEASKQQYQKEYALAKDQFNQQRGQYYAKALSQLAGGIGDIYTAAKQNKLYNEYSTALKKLSTVSIPPLKLLSADPKLQYEWIRRNSRNLNDVTRYMDFFARLGK